MSEHRKTCSMCKTEKSSADFHRNKNTKDGFSEACKSCLSRKSREERKLRKANNAPPIGFKRCSKCQSIKPLELFNSNKTSKDGKTSYCKECHVQHSRQWYHGNKEKAKVSRKAWKDANREKNAEDCRRWRESNKDRVQASREKWAARNPDLAREVKKNWRQLNKDKMREAGRNWRKKNKAKAYELSKRWRENNKEKRRAIVQRWQERNPDAKRIRENIRRGRKNRAAGSFTPEQWIARLRYFGERCYYCGSQGKMTMDHRIPISRGGSNWPSNLVPACLSCNCKKSSKTEFEYLALIASQDSRSHGNSSIEPSRNGEQSSDRHT